MSVASGIFLCDGNKTESYENLLAFVSSEQCFFPTIKTPSLCDYFFNLILALVRGQDITLVDADLSPDEIKSLGIPAVNTPQRIGGMVRFASFDELLCAIKNSISRITVFTSGTTGLPKKVSHTVATLARAVRVSDKYAGHVWGFAYNPTHMAGLQVFLQAFFNRNEIVNLFGKSKNEIFGLIDSQKVSHISATPTFYRLLLPENSVHLSPQRLTCGGEKSDSNLYAKLVEVFPNAKINNIYASTEFGTLLASSGEFFQIPDSASDKIKISGGELLVHRSFLGASDTLRLDGDWYHTGDMVSFEDGSENKFKFVARASNLLNVGGYKVNLEEVEDAVREIPQVSDVVVYGKKNSVLGNILCADVKLLKGESVDVAFIRNFLSKKIQQFKIPRKINFVENIESTRTGKIKR